MEARFEIVTTTTQEAYRCDNEISGVYAADFAEWRASIIVEVTE